MVVKWIKSLFGCNKIDELKKENEDLKQKLVKKQEAINKTNAYWKTRFYELKKRH